VETAQGGAGTPSRGVRCGGLKVVGAGSAWRRRERVGGGGGGCVVGGGGGGWGVFLGGGGSKSLVMAKTRGGDGQGGILDTDGRRNSTSAGRDEQEGVDGTIRVGGKGGTCRREGSPWAVGPIVLKWRGKNKGTYTAGGKKAGFLDQREREAKKALDGGLGKGKEGGVWGAWSGIGVRRRRKGTSHSGG